MIEKNQAPSGLTLGSSAKSLKSIKKNKAEAIGEICELFEQNLSDTNQLKLAFSKNALCRHLLYCALSLDAETPTRKATRRSPAWKNLAARYAEFSKAASLPCTLTTITSDSLRNFGMHAVSSSNSDFFYFSVFLFLINEFETRESFVTLLQEIAPESELDFLNLVKRQVLMPYAKGEEVQNISERLSDIRDLHSVKMGFAVKDHHRAQFDAFFNAFTSNVDGFAHFTAYRHARRDPRFLVKSFIAIGYPTDSRNYYRFFHFYQVPSVGAQKRLSRGYVLPLEKSVYLVGGQSPDKGLSSSYGAFTSLEIIALDWNELRTPESIFGGLMMSTNYNDAQLISPLALRATPIDKYDSLGGPIDRIDLEHLRESLGADVKIEDSLKQPSFVDTSIEQQCEKIERLTNTANLQWQVPEIYKSPSGDAEHLTKTQIDLLLEREFGTKSKPKYKTDSGVPFDFWRSLRFGPISRD